MNKVLTAIGSLLLVTLFGNARPLDSAETKTRQSLLWKISRADMKKPSYLFGTIHLLCPKDYVWTPVMKSSLKACKEVCFEMDMDDPSVMMQVASGMVDNSGKTLKDYFTAEDYKVIERFVTDSLKMSMLLFQQMKPAALQSLFAASTLSCANPVSYESNIMEQAKKQKMEVTGLEEPREQIALFNSLPVDSVISELLKTARDFSKEKNEYQKMLAAYKDQNLQQLFEIIETSRSSGDDFTAFLDERNKKWIERMEERMEQKPVFFAVGAGHLPGENGLIELLRKSGYRVEPVR